MAKKKKTQPTNKLKKKCPQCKVQMQIDTIIIKGFVTKQTDKCPHCGQTDVSETTDAVKE